LSHDYLNELQKKANAHLKLWREKNPKSRNSCIIIKHMHSLKNIPYILILCHLMMAWADCPHLEAWRPPFAGFRQWWRGQDYWKEVPDDHNPLQYR